MTHEEMNEMYELYSLGVLDGDERDEIDEHLARGCPECSRAVKRAVELNAMLLTLPEQVQPPKRLRRRVLASVGSESNSRNWVMGWAALAACLAVALAFVGIKLTTDLRNGNAQLEQARRELKSANTQLASVQEIVQFLNEPQTVQATFGGSQPQPPKGRVLVNANRGVLLIASNLPPVPAGKTYEMWLVPKNGAPQPAGLFQSDPQGNAIHLLRGPFAAGQTAAIGVSVEPEAGSAAPTTTPIIIPIPSD